MRIIIVDDERLQLETIIEYVTEFYPNAEIIGFNKVSDVLKYMETETADIAILDISMPGNINGINLGEILRQKDSRTKLLYCTGFSNYAMDAFKMHANGYLCKPIRKKELRQELQYIMQMPVFGTESKPYIHTFGNFDVFVDNHPLLFKRRKSKEILAYLTDRKGGWVSNQELIVVLWDESCSNIEFAKYISTLVNEMMTTLKNAGIEYIVERKRGKVRLLTNEVICDYYEYLNGEEEDKTTFHFEYMSQYSWGEETLASILQNRKK